METLILFTMSILGQVSHLAFVKIPSLRRTASAANKAFYIKEWWNCDWNLIIGLQAFIIAVFLGLDEIMHFKPEMLEYTKWMFFFVGFGGSSAIMSWLSKYAPGVMNLISVKSNTFDVQAGKVITNANEAIEKGKEITGEDVSKNPTPVK